MKKLLFFACVLIISSAQAREHKQPFIAFSSYEFTHPNYENNIKDIFTNFGGNKLVVKTATGKTKYPINDVWGFLPKDGTACRIYNDGIYKIKQVDTMTIYKRHSGKHSSYYFSAGLNNDIYRLNTKQLKKVYQETNPEFIARLKSDLKWYEDYEKYSDKRKTFKIIEIYKKTISS